MRRQKTLLQRAIITYEIYGLSDTIERKRSGRSQPCYTGCCLATILGVERIWESQCRDD